jgi:hypothetical protein
MVKVTDFVVGWQANLSPKPPLVGYFHWLEDLGAPHFKPKSLGSTSKPTFRVSSSLGLLT